MQVAICLQIFNNCLKTENRDCCICQFLGYKHFYYGRFEATTMMLLNPVWKEKNIIGLHEPEHVNSNPTPVCKTLTEQIILGWEIQFEQ